MLAILAESALRALLLGGVVWIGLNLLRVRNPHVHMTCWAMVLVASLSMPLLMHWTTVTVTVNALPVPAAEHFGQPAAHGATRRRSRCTTCSRPSRACPPLPAARIPRR